MVTIVGNGMGEYNFSNIHIDLNSFDVIVCDVNFKESGENILKLKFAEIKTYLMENYKEKNILYIVTGSPLFFSAGTFFTKIIPHEFLQIINNTSCLDYLAQKLMLPAPEIVSFSLHGRDFIDLEKFLKSKFTFILCDAYSVKRVANAVKYLESKDLKVTMGYKLGFVDEIIEEINIFEEVPEKFDLSMPYVLLLEKNFQSKDLHSPIEDFQTQRGMITKEYKRELSLHHLELKPNELLWDIGAGSGSCGIEAFKQFKVKVKFFEKNQERVENIVANIKTHKVLECEVFEGNAEEIFANLEETPDKIFVGGGGEGVINKLPDLFKKLQTNGILLISAITLKHLTLIVDTLKQSQIAYEVFSLALTTYKGELDLIEPQRQLFQIRCRKGE